MSNTVFKRTINKIGIAVIAVNGLIGAGIFALPAGAAELSGNFSPWMFLICALLMALVVMSFAQLSTGFDDSGGPVLYTQQAFGDHVSFQTTWLLYVGRLTALAANSNALIFYLGFIYSPINTGAVKPFAILMVLSILTVINLFGVKKTMSILQGMTMLKLLPLILFIGVGAFHINPQILFSAPELSLSEFEATLLLLVYAFIGFEGALVPAGESKDPTKNIASALLITLVGTAVIYFFIQSISISILPDIAVSSTPMADAAVLMVGGIGGLIISIAAIVSITGNLSTVVFTAPRMTSALAQQGNFPHWFSVLTPKEQIPRNAILFLVFVAAVLAITGSFVWLAIISSLARLIGYFIAIAALVKLKPQLIEQNKWMLPLGLVVPASALLVCGWLAMQADFTSWFMTLAFMLVGSGLYYGSRYRSSP